MSRHHHHHHLDGSAPLDLLDEYWFFSNTLNVKKKPPKQSPSTTKQQPQPQGRQGCRSLLRTPSLPSPRIPEINELVVVEEQAEEEVDDDDLNWSSIYEGILRTRIAAPPAGRSSPSSALQRAPSMPVVPSSDGRRKEKAEMASSNKLMHSYSMRLERDCTPTTAYSKQTPPRRSSRFRSKQPPLVMVRSKSTVFRHEAADKKTWKSSSDLESIEVQGFKDLGFVFDKDELREDLSDVVPGLKNSGHGTAVRRPYLSEAWHHDRQPPALIRVHSEAKSAAEIKNQLRMWAQAVACNVRQECV